MVKIAGAGGGLCRRRWRHFPGSIGEVKEFRHVHLCRVSSGQTGQPETSLDELQHSGVIGDSMRHVVFLGKWRYHDQGHAKPGVVEVACRTSHGRANISGEKVEGRKAVGVDGGLGSDMIVESTKFIPSENESGILPRSTIHEPVNQARYIVGAFLHAGAGDVVVLSGMLVQSVVVARINDRYLRQSAFGRIGKELAGVDD